MNSKVMTAKRSGMSDNKKRALRGLIVAVCVAVLAPRLALSGALVPNALLEQLDKGTPQDLIVEFDDSDIQARAENRRIAAGAPRETADITADKVVAYSAVKREALGTLAAKDFTLLHDYSHLPLAHIRFHNSAALRSLALHYRVRAIFPDEIKRSSLLQSLPLVNQPLAVASGATGSGTTVAILDSGVNYTLPAFGSCSSPGLPASCRVAVGSLDDCNHGTNVSGIVAGVAPGARLAVYDVAETCTNASTWQWTTHDTTVIGGINWAIANRATYNISVINMSLGSDAVFSGPCSTAYHTPVSQARAAGIVVVASAGNNAQTAALTSPACDSGVISVGGVYDANLGTVGFTNCSDTSTAADRVMCISNSASFLNMLAPGGAITAAGLTGYGTSMAAPHVSGAAAMLRALFPNESVDQVASRLINGGKPILDPRNGLVKPRLDIFASVLPNDQFANRVVLSGISGRVQVENTIATLESGEPAHAGRVGGRSVWWKWVAPVSGQVTVDTHGSTGDTTLAIYTGIAVGALTSVAANDNDGSSGGTSGLTFVATKGTEYEIAVDTVGGTSAEITLHWSAMGWLPPILNLLLQ